MNLVDRRETACLAAYTVYSSGGLRHSTFHRIFSQAAMLEWLNLR